ncbi:MAG TPA: hypothetical protein VGP69_12225 [Gaiellaceae bacterium]|nr:hypothetical protein [Gaiellaceae bacterium]
MKSIGQRYVTATIVFVLCGLWLGVGLVNGLVCLASFAASVLVVRVLQARDDRRRTAAAPRSRRRESRRERPRQTRPAPPLDDVEGFGWPRTMSGA